MISHADVLNQSPPTELEGKGERYLVFSLMHMEVALKAEYVQGVERFEECTPVPNVASWITGVVNLRGSIASVIDLQAFLGMGSSLTRSGLKGKRPSKPFSPSSNLHVRLLSVQYKDVLICLIVDAVSSIVLIPDAAITYMGQTQNTFPQWIAPYASGRAWLDTRAIVLLDAERLLFSEKMQQYEVKEEKRRIYG